MSMTATSALPSAWDRTSAGTRPHTKETLVSSPASSARKGFFLMFSANKDVYNLKSFDVI
jgi:hypothetical protein